MNSYRVLWDRNEWLRGEFGLFSFLVQAAGVVPFCLVYHSSRNHLSIFQQIFMPVYYLRSRCTWQQLFDKVGQTLPLLEVALQDFILPNISWRCAVLMCSLFHHLILHWSCHYYIINLITTIFFSLQWFCIWYETFNFKNLS